jgi:hypothetical protein
MAQSFGMAGEATDAMAGGFEDGQKAPADVAGGPGEENSFGVRRICHDSVLNFVWRPKEKEGAGFYEEPAPF